MSRFLSSWKNRDKNKGFTLAEVLIVVAIIVVLFAIGVPAIFKIQKNLRQKELDAKAETIYMAVQDRLTELYASGRSGLYDPASYDGSLVKYGELPGDSAYIENLRMGEDSLYYFLKGSAPAEKIVTEDLLSDDLMSGHWVVEILPYTAEEVGTSVYKAGALTAASVYAVYYSENTDKVDLEKEYVSDRDLYNNTMRDRTGRLENGAWVGYYGGANIASSSSTYKLVPDEVLFNNAEKLTADVSFTKPLSVSEKLVFTFDFSDGTNKYTITYDEKTGVYQNGDGTILDVSDFITFSKTGERKYKFTISVDDLSDEKTRFTTLFGKDSNHGTGKELVAGQNVTLTVGIQCPDNSNTEPGEKSDTANSLFANDSTSSKAIVTYGRHLQNLDEKSGVTEKITEAEQKNTIDFSTEKEWYETYGEAYYNGLTEYTAISSSGTVSVQAPNFSPIHNTYLTLFTGGKETCPIVNLNVNTTGSDVAGLFGVLGDGDTDVKISDVVLTGAQIRSASEAGYIAGSVSGSHSVTLEGCEVYLVRGTDIPTAITESMNVESVLWGNGKTIGGLVGSNNGSLTISKSLAAMVLGGTTTGGLVGKNAGTLTLSESYADSYLYGDAVGGLVGTAGGSVKVDSCYAAGFIGLNTKKSVGAGLVNGAVSEISNSYTIISCYRKASDGGIDKTAGKVTDPENGTYYSTAVSGAVSAVYYFSGSTDKTFNLSGTEIMNDISSAELLTKINSKDVFQINTEGSQPYKLIGQSLSTYTYPRLTALSHYGDWEMEFTSGTFGYYEVYKDDDTDSDGTKDESTQFGLEADGITSTLSDKGTIVGDGYGVVFKENDSTAESVEVKSGDKTVLINPTEGEEGKDYYVVTMDKVTYRVYPLPADIVNAVPSASFYTKLSITQTTHSEDASEQSATDTRYYLYCPHFARTVVSLTEDTDPATKAAPENIEIRSPRHLYNLSLYYDDYYRSYAPSSSYIQERDMVYSSYDWTDYTLETATVNSQYPIGRTASKSFDNKYYGGCYKIADVSFITDSGNYVGLFGCTGSSSLIKDVVLVTDYHQDGKTNYTVRRVQPASENETVWYGIVAGYNAGTITNTAVAGYNLTGADGTIHGYANSRAYIGGFVGQNDGQINNSEADSPRLSLSTYRTSGYAGGFVGYNSGSIRDSYAIGHIDCVAQGGDMRIAGFAACNVGTISQSYCGTALTSSGDGTSSYGFAPDGDGGAVNTSYYLNTGSYQFVDGLYPFEIKTGLGTYRTYEQLVRLNTTPAVYSYNHTNTTALNSSETNYPFRTVVTNAAGEAVHYGEWQLKPELGNLGFFYWEKEENGSNDGYKLTYIGTDEGQERYQTTLCVAHDDGGVITEFGYGYYIRQGEEDLLKVSFDGADSSKDSGKTQETAKVSFETQIPGYTFYPYTTTDTQSSGDYICFTGTGATATCYLTYDGANSNHTYQYKFSPLFANSMQIVGIDSASVKDNGGRVTDYAKGIGTDSSNPFEVRSAKQLQYINWNCNKKNASTLVTTDKNVYQNFNYLMYASVIGQGVQTKSGAGNNTYRYWLQTHDLNAASVTDYVPIAGNTTSSNNDAYNATLYAWFGGSYNGQSYKIQELSIDSKSYTVGVFGVTVGAQIENVILYSKNAATIKRSASNTDTIGSYAIGGLIGVAYDYNSPENKTITNCAVAGYKIIDDSKNAQGLGEANVGGLIGVSNVNIDKCSAVTDIEINCTHKNSSGNIVLAKWGNYIRVGGISGAVQGSVTNSYSGGQMTVGSETLDETYTSSNVHVDQSSNTQANVQHSTNVYLAGIAGCGFAMNYYNFTNQSSLKEGNPTITNCYTYVEFPKLEGTIRAIAMIASIADRYSNGPHVTINNCYYFERSGIIDTSNLPKYYFSDSVTSLSDLSKNTIDGHTYIQDMCMGYVNWENQMFRGTDVSGASGKLSTTSKTYDELSAGSMPGSLSGSFGKVTTTDASGATINGKYSFPGSETSLDGKNYPFPTVITQKDLTFGNTVNVHYGRWPHDSAYWTLGTGTMDIFDDMTDDGYAYKTFEIRKGASSLTSLDVSSFTVGGSDSKGEYAEVTKVEQKDSDSWTVTVRALKEGTTEIKEKTTGASFTLGVTAKLKVTSDPSVMIVEKGNTAVLTVTAKSQNDTDYSTAKNLSWTLTPSKAAEKEGDVGIELKSKSVKNVYKVTGYGYNANITVKASYTYNGNEYSASTLTVVQRTGNVGICYTGADTSDVYMKADVSKEDTGTIKGAVRTFEEGEQKPVRPADCDLYIYDTTAAGLLDYYVDSYTKEFSSIAIKVKKNGAELTNVKLTIDKALSETEGNSYRTIGVQLYEEVEAGEKESGTVDLEITVQSKNGTIYEFDVKDYSLRAKVKVYVNYKPEVETTTLYQDIAYKGEGYKLWNGAKLKEAGYAVPANNALWGWKDKDEKEYEAGTNVNLTEETTYTAIWKPAIILDANSGTFENEDTQYNCFMDDEQAQLTLSEETYPVARKGYTLKCWNTKQDGTGTEYSKDGTGDKPSIETLMRDGSNILYAQWEPDSTAIVLDLGEYKPAEGTSQNQMILAVYNSHDLGEEVDKPYSTPKIQDQNGSRLQGWYTGPNGKGSQIIAVDQNKTDFASLTLAANVKNYTDKDGNWIYLPEDEADNTITLYAYFITPHTLTLKNNLETYYETVTIGGETSLDLTEHTTEYTKPSDRMEDWTFDGWFTAEDKITGERTQVLNTEGFVISGLTLDGYAKDGELALTEDRTLYARWSHADEVYTLADDGFEENGEYLITNSNADAAYIAMQDKLEQDKNKIGYVRQSDNLYTVLTSHLGYFDDNGKEYTKPIIDSAVPDTAIWTAKNYSGSDYYLINKANGHYLYDAGQSVYSNWAVYAVDKDSITKTNKSYWQYFKDTDGQKSGLWNSNSWHLRFITSHSDEVIYCSGSTGANRIYLYEKTAVTYYDFGKFHKVTLNENYDSGDERTYDVAESHGLTLPDLTREGYRLTAWTTNPDGTGDSYSPFTRLTITEDNKTLYAQWEKTYTLTFHTSSTADDTTVIEDYVSGNVVIDAPTMTDWSFDGWIDDSGDIVFNTEGICQQSITQNTNLYAKWKRSDVYAEYNAGALTSGNYLIFGSGEMMYGESDRNGSKIDRGNAPGTTSVTAYDANGYSVGSYCTEPENKHYIWVVTEDRYLKFYNTDYYLTAGYITGETQISQRNDVFSSVTTTRPDGTCVWSWTPDGTSGSGQLNNNGYCLTTNTNRQFALRASASITLYKQETIYQYAQGYTVPKNEIATVSLTSLFSNALVKEDSELTDEEKDALTPEENTKEALTGNAEEGLTEGSEEAGQEAKQESATDGTVEETGDESAGDESTGDESTGDESTGETTGGTSEGSPDSVTGSQTGNSEGASQNPSELSTGTDNNTPGETTSETSTIPAGNDSGINSQSTENLAEGQ